VQHPAAWLRAVAALANNRGGYVFFGVRDKDAAGAHQVIGLANGDFADTDPAEIVKRLRATVLHGLEVRTH
jgi:predicted HTH transcriptional regulator